MLTEHKESQQEIEQLRKKIEQLENELAVLNSFYNVTLKERDYERFLNHKLQEKLNYLKEIFNP